MRKGMNEVFVTSFWQQAYERLPAHSRAQYLTHMKAAERWELALNRWIEAVTQVKNVLGRVFQTPRSAH